MKRSTCGSNLTEATTDAPSISINPACISVSSLIGWIACRTTSRSTGTSIRNSLIRMLSGVRCMVRRKRIGTSLLTNCGSPLMPSVSKTPSAVKPAFSKTSLNRAYSSWSGKENVLISGLWCLCLVMILHLPQALNPL